MGVAGVVPPVSCQLVKPVLAVHTGCCAGSATLCEMNTKTLDVLVKVVDMQRA
jgi:hypothetical protein